MQKEGTAQKPGAVVRSFSRSISLRMPSTSKKPPQRFEALREIREPSSRLADRHGRRHEKNLLASGSDANSVPTATSASARFVVTPDSRTNAALLEASCSGRGGGQNSRPSM